ncbi:MAG: glycosyltransferase [Proteobacteria bacterium]|nr:glycosyltransferase [Pseudomonadota bacterium]
MRCPTLKDLPPPPSGKTGWPWTEESPQLPNTTPGGDPWPKISIVTPSFNQSAYLEATIRSVLLQGYPNLEYIIMDAGSSDNSLSIIKKYEPWLTFWTSKKDKGQSDGINNGFKQATGVLVNWLNSDDQYLPGALFKVAIAYLNSGHTDCAVVGKCHWVNTKGRVLYEQLPNKLDQLAVAACGENWIPQPSGFFTREAFWKAGGLQLDLHHAMDFDLYVKLAKEVPFVRIDDCLALALAHPDAKTKAQREKMFAEVRIIQFRNGYESLARAGLESDYSRLIRYQKATKLLRNNFITKAIRNVVNSKCWPQKGRQN